MLRFLIPTSFIVLGGWYTLTAGDLAWEQITIDINKIL